MDDFTREFQPFLVDSSRCVIPRSIATSNYTDWVNGRHDLSMTSHSYIWRGICSELIVDNWNDNCDAKSKAKCPRPLRGLQVDFSLTRNVSNAVR